MNTEQKAYSAAMQAVRTEHDHGTADLYDFILSQATRLQRDFRAGRRFLRFWLCDADYKRASALL